MSNDKEITFLIIVATHDKNRAISAIEYHSKHSRNFVIAYSNNNPDTEVLDCIEKNKVKHIIRNNVGRDYGAYYDCINENYTSYDWFIMLNDDITFVDPNWLDTIIANFKISDADILSLQTGCNNKGKLIPRGSLWCVRNYVFDKLIWEKPLNDEDAYNQEAYMIPKLMNKYGFKMKQIGNGLNIMYPDNYGPGKLSIGLSDGEVYG